jgi:NAD-dependent DNA ligase
LGALVWAKYWKLDLVEVKDDIYDKSEKPLKEKENEFAEAKEQWGANYF